jgi:succinylglutamate desuccinylase
MKILSNCEALLDLHGYNSPEDTPFAITDGKGLEVVKIFNFDKVVVGIDKISQGGTDGYMLNAGKVGICLECGSNDRPESYVALALDSIYKFLQYYGLINSQSSNRKKQQRVFSVVSMAKKQTNNFSFDRPYKNFDALEPNCVFATDGNSQYVAKKNQYIIFPRSDEKIGQDAFTVIESMERD